MTQPDPLPTDLPPWERGLREVLGAEEMNSNHFTQPAWISLTNVGFYVNSKHKPWEDSMGTPDQNEFTIYRRTARGVEVNYAPRARAADISQLSSQQFDLAYYIIRGKVNWFEKSGQFSPEDYWHEFYDRSKAAVKSPPHPPLLHPETFHESANSFDNLALWLEDAARRLTAEVNNLGGEDSSFRGAAAEGLRESLTNLRDELSLLREDLRTADDWAAMLDRNGDAATTFLTEINKAWDAFDVHPGRYPRTMVVAAMRDIEKAIDELGQRTEKWNNQARYENLLIVWEELTEWKIPIDIGNNVKKEYDFIDPGQALADLNADMHAFFAEAAQVLHNTMATQFQNLRESFETTYQKLVDPRTYTAPPSSDSLDNKLDLNSVLGNAGGTGAGGNTDINSLLSKVGSTGTGGN
ncbi:hypothetical protein ACWDV4_28955, partial [Micromonospora sp. NPDC003197]